MRKLLLSLYFVLFCTGMACAADFQYVSFAVTDQSLATTSNVTFGNVNASQGNFTTIKGEGSNITGVTASAAWGQITGTLSGQSDLQSALDAKTAIGHTHDWTNISTGKPTTLSGYGITDFAAVRQTSDVMSVVVALVPLPGLTFNFAANSNYTFDMYMLCMSNLTTTGYRFALDTSVAVTAVGLNYYHQLANTGTLSGGSSNADNTSTGTTSGIATANITIPVMGMGMLSTGANAGTANFTFGSETTANATCKAGSIIRIYKVN